MKTVSLINSIVLTLTLACFGAHAAEPDYKESRDHPEIPRVEGTWIGGYSFAEYDAGLFAVNGSAGDPETVSPEGKRTRILYVGEKTQSSLQMFRNYQMAFSALGELKEVYSCQRKACSEARIGAAVVWSENNKVPNDFALFHNFGDDSTHQDPMYFYGTVEKNGRRYHVSVFTALVTNKMVKKADNRPVVHLEVLEEENFVPTLTTVNAVEMSNQLDSVGHVAVYGIQFDTNSANLKPASSPIVAEIAKVLAAEPAMNAYVVGHTDSDGEFAYNQSLSLQRAASVVASLTSTHGINAERLTAVGVGPVSPKASNATNDGRALNRRVEIVKRD